MKATEKQLREILDLKVIGDGCKNYSVKAGAGGGKTTMLSHRICQQILLGVSIQDFVIITYTNAAAAELREKITVNLQKLINEGISDDKQKTNAIEAFNSIELMQISTIHAFLFKILQEYSFEAGIVMDARMLEDSEDSERKKTFFDQWYREHHDDMDMFGEDWVVENKSGYKTDLKRAVLENMFNDIANIREEIVFDTSDHSEEIEIEAVNYVNKWLPELRNFKFEFMNNRPINKNKEPKKISKASEKILEYINTVLGKLTYNMEDAQILSNALSDIKTMVDKGDSFYGKTEDGISANIALQSAIPTFPKNDLEWNFNKRYEYVIGAQKAGLVVEYVSTMQKEYQKEVDEETRVLSNDDILYRAEKLLTDNTDILDKLRERYSKIYVDEFQDTTGLQTRIIKLISELKGTSLSDNKLSDDKLLVVGDPKQSIYRFTGAEKAIYDETDKLMSQSANAESVSLDTNFRSNKDIVEWVNNSFGKLMLGGYTCMDTDWTVSENKALHGVYQYKRKEVYDDKGKLIPYTKQDDVHAVVGLVKRLVGNTYCFIEKCNRRADGSFEKATNCSIQYSDIMIICKNTTNMSDYVNGFALEGIPVNVQGKFKIDDDEILKNFVILVDYFACYKNKKMRIAAIQVLDGVDVTRISEDFLREEEKRLREIRKVFVNNNMDSAAILQYLLVREELFLPKGKEYPCEKVRSYRIRLHQMVETCLSKNNGDLRDTVKCLKNYLDNFVRREIPLESNENAVRLMNAHQSKGLTGQIVIIADRSSNEECRYGGFKKDGKYYPAVTYKQSLYSAPTIVPSYGSDYGILKQVYIDEMDEVIRLQYVAATRAAHALIIMPVASKNNVPWFSDKNYGYDSLNDIRQWLEEREKDTTDYSVVEQSISSNHNVLKLDDLKKNIRISDLSQLAGSQIISVTPSSLELAGLTGYIKTDMNYVKEKRPSANIFGTVMHRVYELIFLRYERVKCLSGEDIEKQIERIINQALLEQADEMRKVDKPQEFMEFLKPIIINYLDQVISPIVESAVEIYPEYMFSFYLTQEEKLQFIDVFNKYTNIISKDVKKDSCRIWINGQADLVVKQKDGNIKVYDFKSDSRNGKPLELFEEDMSKKYEGQLSLYQHAIGKAFHTSEVTTELIHLYR